MEEVNEQFESLDYFQNALNTNIQFMEEIENNFESIFASNECLLSKSDAIETLKKDYGRSDITNPDDNLRFILGKCNPVLFVPGIYASKLVLNVNCKGLKDNDKEIYKEMRVYCTDTICKDTTVTSEERPLFVALFDNSFTILNSKTNLYSSCLGFFMQFFNKETECPKLDNGKLTCKYSKYIRISFYGGTPKTVDDSLCGMKTMEDVIQTGNKLADTLANQGAAKVYHEMIKKFKDLGYKEGFSYGGLPQDYRRFTSTNKFSANTFRYQINKLYENTGKPVVIVAHSYGTLLTLNNLLNSGNKDLLPKIKKFIAMAPPFAGASKLLDIYLKGNHAWDVEFQFAGKTIKITNYDIFGQNMMYKSMPAVMELRPLHITNKLFNDNEYKDFGNAITERIALEKYCKEKGCTTDYIKNHSKEFNKYFSDYFPSLDESICINNNLKSPNPDVFNKKCYTELYNIGHCPSILLKTNTFKPTSNNILNYCDKNQAELLYSRDCSKGACLDEIYKGIGPYVYAEKNKVSQLIERFNEKWGNELGKISESYFETKDEIVAKTKKIVDYYETISKTKDLTISPVDTDIVYATFYPTHSAFIYDKQSSEQFTANEYLSSGGDNTVPNWSSLITGLKWIYDKKKNNLKQNINLIEYCSLLGYSGKYVHVPGANQKFSAIGCDCISNGDYNIKSFKKCSHAAMLNDNYLIEYIKGQINNPKETIKVT